MQPSAITDYSDAANPVQKNIRPGLLVEDLKFEYFTLVGVIAGSVISLVVLKEKANKKNHLLSGFDL